MPVSKKWAYFDHAAVSPLPEITRHSIVKWASQASQDGDICWPEWSAANESLRRLGASLLTALDDEIALVPNTTTGINLISEGIRWKTGENVVVLENEFPSNMLPWLNLERRGIELRKVPVLPDGAVCLSAIDRAIDSRTRIVSASWVGYASGYRLDVAKVCDLVHQRGALFFLDAIQGLGVFPLNLSAIDVDFLAADGHKWLLGPEGAGLLFIRQKNLDLLDPIFVGWGSVRNAHHFDQTELDFKPAASRYESGSANMVGLGGLAASLNLLLDLGCNHPNSPVAAAVLENASQISDQLRRAGATVFTPGELAHQSGIVPFSWPGQDPLSVRKRLLDRGVVLSCRQGRLRISTHAYNNSDDFNRLIEALPVVER